MRKPQALRAVFVLPLFGSFPSGAVRRCSRRASAAIVMPGVAENLQAGSNTDLALGRAECPGCWDLG